MPDILDSGIYEDPPDETHDWRIFIGPHADYYIHQWQALRSGRWWSFNFPAFLVGGLWMIYRKMYLTTLLYLLIVLGIDYLEAFILQRISPAPWMYPASNILSTLLLAVVVGFAGNWLYFEESQWKIDRLKRKYPERPLLERKLARAGGTSYLSLGILFLILFFLALLANFNLTI